MDEPEEIKALRTALSFSPENDILREHLVKTLQKCGRHESAIEAASEGLAMNPEYSSFQELLAESYAQTQKRSEAFTILEALEKKRSTLSSGPTFICTPTLSNN